MEIDGKRAALNEVVAIKRSRYATSILLMPDIMQSRSREKPLKGEKQGYFILI